MNCSKCGMEIGVNGTCQNCEAHSNQKTFWNPNAVANWSLLYTQIFGAWLTYLNWQKLGEAAHAERSKQWLIGSMVWLPLSVIMLNVTDNMSFGFSLIASDIVLLLSWFFLENRKQNKYLLERFGKAYPRRPWGKPLAIAAATLLSLQLVGWAKEWSNASGVPRCDNAEVKKLAMSIATQTMQNILFRQYFPQGNYEEAKNIIRAEVKTPDDQAAKQLIAESLEKVDKQMAENNMKMTGIRSIGEDATIHKSACAAFVVFNNGNITNLIYSAQYTADGQVYVEAKL